MPAKLTKESARKIPVTFSLSRDFLDVFEQFRKCRIQTLGENTTQSQVFESILLDLFEFDMSDPMDVRKHLRLYAKNLNDKYLKEDDDEEEQEPLLRYDPREDVEPEDEDVPVQKTSGKQGAIPEGYGYTMQGVLKKINDMTSFELSGMHDDDEETPSDSEETEEEEEDESGDELAPNEFRDESGAIIVTAVDPNPNLNLNLDPIVEESMKRIFPSGKRSPLDYETDETEEEEEEEE